MLARRSPAGHRRGPLGEEVPLHPGIPLGPDGALPVNPRAHVGASAAPTPTSGVKTITLWLCYEGVLTC